MYRGVSHSQVIEVVGGPTVEGLGAGLGVGRR